jgi:error-prone DNA polymerase
MELPEMPLPEEVVTDYQVTRLSLKGHPMQFLRPVLEREAVLSCAEAARARNGRIERVAGVVLIRQRPGKGNALFITLEDETGITNVLLWARDFERYRREVMAARLMEVEGEIQRSKEGVMHVIARRVFDRSALLNRLTEDSLKALPERHGHPRNVRVLPKIAGFSLILTEEGIKVPRQSSHWRCRRLRTSFEGHTASRAHAAHAPGLPSAWFRWRQADVQERLPRH